MLTKIVVSVGYIFTADLVNALIPMVVLISEGALTHLHAYIQNKTCFQHCPLISDNGPVKSTGPGSLNPCSL